MDGAAGREECRATTPNVNYRSNRKGRSPERVEAAGRLAPGVD
jgi:hypothetical protein